MTERTYGSIRREAGQWVVRAEPHVMMRLKRVFEKIDKWRHGEVALTATAENSRDLLWFTQRYPLLVEWSDRVELERHAHEHKDKIAGIRDLLDPDYTPRDFDLALPAREYQRRAAEVLLAQGFLLLGDDVGLGKTVSAIATLTEPRTLPCVVVTKTILPPQWEDELARFAPALHVHIVRTGKPYALPKKRGRGPDVVILNYAKLYGWAETLAAYGKSVVFDEIQELRRDQSAKYGAGLHLARACEYRMGLSATPIYNYGGEIFNVLDLLSEGCLGSREEFSREWCTYQRGQMRVEDPRAFGSYLREHTLILRRTRREVGRELPPETRITQRIDTDRRAFDQVESTVAELARRILSVAESYRGERMNAAGKLDSLMRQATGVAKAPNVADFVSLLVESGEKVVLYGWHREVYSIWESQLRQYRPAFITGEETTAEKLAAKAAFINGQTPILIISLRSGEGVDGLQRVCRIAVFGELDWAPGVHEQCIGRIARDGQLFEVLVYYLVAEEGADPIMCEVLGLKREQAEGIRSPELDNPFEVLEDGRQHAVRLAEAYLAKRPQRRSA